MCVPVPRHLCNRCPCMHCCARVRAQGDLILRCQLVFPPTLSQEQKLLLRAALLLPARPSAAQGRALRAFEGAFRDASTGWSSGVAASASSDGAQQ